MRKYIGLMLCAVFIASAAGCEKKEDVRGTVEKETAQVSETENQTAEESETQEENSDATEEFSFGTVKSNVYENEFIGIGCKLDSEWTFFDDEKIMEMNNIASEYLSGDAAEMVADADIIYDMYAMRSDGSANINVNLENIGPVKYITIDIAEGMEATKEYLTDTYNNMGYSVDSMEAASIEIDGEQFDGLSVKASSNDSYMYQTLFSIKCGGKYLASITVTSFEEDTVQEILDTFYVID